MKNKSCYILFILCLISFFSYSQIKGKIVDKLEQKPISYANITIKGKSFGTVSNENGDFFINKRYYQPNDTLRISHLNYRTEYFFNLNEKPQIELTQKEQILNEVLISTKKKKIKEKIVGTKTKSGNVILYFQTYNLGSEVGKLINVKKNKTYDLKNVSFMIYDFGLKKARLRVNFYKFKDNIVEVENSNTNENIVEIKEKGLVTIDLSNQNLSFDSDFVVAIELLNYEIDRNIPKENRIIDFSSTVFSGPFFNRKNIHLKWNKIKEKFNIGLGINLLVESYNKE